MGKKVSSITLLATCILAFLAGLQLMKLDFDYNFESFFPKDNSSTDFFLEYRQKFGTDNDQVFVGIRQNSGVIDSSFLKRLHQCSEELQNVRNVTRVASLTTVPELRKYPMFPKLTSVPFFRPDMPELFSQDSLRITRSPELVNRLISSNWKSTLIICDHTQLLDESGCRQLAKDIERMVAKYNFDEVHYAGRSFGQSVYVEIIQNDVAVFVLSSVLLVILFLVLAYRSWWGVWMPLSVVGLTVLFTLSTMALTGKGIDLISNIIPTVLMVIGISAVVHLFTNYIDRRRQYQPLSDALVGAMREVGMATVFTTITTAIGFLTLLNSDVLPVEELGIYTTIGLLFSFLFTYTWFPSLIYLNDPGGGEKRNLLKSFWQRPLLQLFFMIQTRPKLILSLSLLIGILGLMGSSMIKKNNYVLEDLRDEHPQQQAFQFIEDQFSGARPFELYLFLPDSDKTFFDQDVMTEVAKLHHYLENEYGVGQLLSPYEIARISNKIDHQGKIEYYKLPAGQDKLYRIEKNLFKYAKQIDLSKLITRDMKEARLSGFIPDMGSLEVEKRNAELRSFFKNEMKTGVLDYRLTGTASLIDINTNYVSTNVIEGLLLAFVIIGLIIGLMFKSIKMAFISLLPNILPLLVTGGIMGFFGIDLKLSTSLIFIISFGIAVDDSIHFLSRYRQEKLKYHNAGNIPALRQTFIGTGKAIIITSLIISGGFLSLCFSQFLGTFYIGFLICITLISALIADLFLLPAILILFDNE